MGFFKTEKLNSVKKFFQRFYPYFASCGLVLALYLALLVMLKIYPFGEYSIASYDLSAQICPFVEHIFDVLKGRSSLFYTHAIAGGADMFGSLAYFIVSPFSPLFLAFGEGMVAEAAVLVLGVKIVLLAFVGTWFASTQFKIHKIACACLGVLYAYCGYMFVANTYINWLDILLYMPFLVWAFKRFVATEKFWAFSALMAGCVYASFSIACFSMFTVYPVLVAYAFFCVEKEKRLRFIAYLSLAFVCAILIALPVLLPSLLSFMRAGRGGSLFTEMFYGFSANGFNTDGYLKRWVNSLEAKLSYVLSDAVLVVLTFVYFFRSKLKTGLSRFMLVAGIFTLLPTIVDESMLLMNMGSYLSYALRFGFLNAIYFLGGACLGLNGLELFKTEERRSEFVGTECMEIGEPDSMKIGKKTGAGLRRKNFAPLVYSILGGTLFIAAAIFFAFDYHLKAAVIFTDSTVANAVKSFSGRFAHSIGGIFAVGIFFVVVLLILGSGIVLKAARKIPMRVVSLFAVALVVFHAVFFNMVLVSGNRSSQNIHWGYYGDLAATLKEMDDEDTPFYRIRDYDNKYTANIGFEGETYVFTAFSSMLDKNNFAVPVLFGYSGNGKNISRGNGGNIFGDSLQGYRYLLVSSGSKKKVEEKSWFKPVMVEQNGESVPLTKGGMYVYENRYVFPAAFVVDGGEYRFVQENNSSLNRTENQLALYHFLGGDKSVTQITGSKIKALADDLWTRSGDISLSKNTISVNVSAGQGKYLMVSFVNIDGYQVRVNGKSSTLVENDLNFLCVPLDEGENVVEFTYNTPYDDYIFLSLLISVLGVAFVVLFMKDGRRFQKCEKTVGVMGIALAGAVTAFFFVFPTGVFIVKLMTMLIGLF